MPDNRNTKHLLLRNAPVDILFDLDELRLILHKRTGKKKTREDVLFPILRESVKKKLQSLKATAKKAEVA